MALASGIYGPFVRDAITNAKAFALNASDTIKQDLQSDTATPNFNTHDELADLTNIVTGTGWAGAITLASPTFAISTGYATFDGTDVSASTTTLASVEGITLWDDTIAGDPLLCTVDFGSTYATTAGTFAITWSASGIFRFKYDPSA
jgi:hypothetical protein